ncbi:MAG: hypothetical protein J5725_04385 [Bacteroidales bacterium]|nr:hypothetical protein [Bacteroidales bacterium]
MTNREIYEAVTNKTPSEDDVEFKNQCKELLKEARSIIATPGVSVGYTILALYVIHNLHIED